MPFSEKKFACNARTQMFNLRTYTCTYTTCIMCIVHCTYKKVQSTEGYPATIQLLNSSSTKKKRL